MRFNAKTLKTQGEAKPVATGVMSSSGRGGADAYNGASQLSIASNGTAVYVPGRESTDLLAKLVITDRDGKVQFEHHDTGLFKDPRFSPDGKTLALRFVADGRQQIGLLDIGRDTLMQFTRDDANVGLPVWSNDGKWLAYAVFGDKESRVDLRPLDGSRPAETLTTHQGIVGPTSFLPGDKSLLIARFVSGSDANTETLSIADKTTKILMASPASEFLAQI